MTNSATNIEDRSSADRSLVVPASDGDERVRELIRQELDRQNAVPVARRTLELLAEAAVEPASGPTGYRIVDRHGETRLQAPPTPAVSRKKGKDRTLVEEPLAPLTLGDLVTELRDIHPDLFGPPPEPPAPPAPATAEPSVAHDRLASFKSASAHFVETQTALARSLVAKSSERRRAFSKTAGGVVEDLRKRIDDYGNRQHRPAGEGATRAATTGAGSSMAERRGPAWSALGSGAIARLRSNSTRMAARFRKDPDQAPGVVPAGTAVRVPENGEPARHGRKVAIGLAGATAVALLAAVLTVGRQASLPGDDAADVTKPARPSSPPDTSSQTATPPSDASRSTLATPSQADPELQPSDDAPKDANDISGVPEVVDTATLRLSGKSVRLFGVEWVRGGQADELAKYLGGRKVTCQPAPGSSAYLCTVDGRDLSEVVLFNGGGRASPEATPDLAAAEDHARSERLGVWKR